ncbi:unannotated protein [freshwater metagenome]|uniref:Unannotated protein n=1 Tax=freshwater metagenome TaxID=449393 RepID=A0A6J7NU27_9ZZZZ
MFRSWVTVIATAKELPVLRLKEGAPPCLRNSPFQYSSRLPPQEAWSTTSARMPSKYRIESSSRCRAVPLGWVSPQSNSMMKSGQLQKASSPMGWSLASELGLCRAPAMSGRWSITRFGTPARLVCPSTRLHRPSRCSGSSATLARSRYSLRRESTRRYLIRLRLTSPKSHVCGSSMTALLTR